MALALDILLSGLVLLVLADLVTGLATGRMRLLGGNIKASPGMFWGYAGVEAILVIFVGSLWL